MIKIKTNTNLWVNYGKPDPGEYVAVYNKSFGLLGFYNLNKPNLRLMIDPKFHEILKVQILPESENSDEVDCNRSGDEQA